jgi:hypothetical protein
MEVVSSRSASFQSAVLKVRQRNITQSELADNKSKLTIPGYTSITCFKIRVILIYLHISLEGGGENVKRAFE